MSKGDRLSGKRIVITGAGGGLGLAYARRLGGEGASVIIAEINDALGRNAEAELRRDGIDARFIHTDVADEASVMAMAKQAGEGIHGVICNAAWAANLGNKTFLELDVESWDRMMAINVRGTWLTVKAIAPRMNDGGSIITITSGAITSGTQRILHYVTSKSALIGMTRSLAGELGARQIRVNSIMPGLTIADSTKNVSQERWEGYRQRKMLKRDQAPEDLDGVVVFLMCDESRFMTGQVLCVDGGYTLY